MNIILGSVASSINVSTGAVFDTDALNYIQAVEIADGQALEGFVKTAINTFVVGLKTDGIWSDISACGILAGARTLSGALVPLKGPQPTNFNFVAGDYSRSLGLSGDGLTKYIDTNERTDSRPLTSSHISVYMSKIMQLPSSLGGNRFLAGTSTAGSQDFIFTSNSVAVSNNITMVIRRASGPGVTTFLAGSGNIVGFKGGSRSSSSSSLYRSSGFEQFSSTGLTSPIITQTQYLFAGRLGVSPFSPTGFSNAGLTFYSIGSATDIRKLDSGVTTLMQTLSTII